MNSEFELPFPQYRCPTCGKDLPLGEARMTVTCAGHTDRTPVEFAVRRGEAGDRAAIETICDRALGETVVDVFGSTFDVLEGINMVAMADDDLVGLLSLAIHKGEGAVILMSVYPEYQGMSVGSSLLKAAEEFCLERGLQFMRAAVTNDDIPLIYFYQRHGFSIAEIAVGEVADRFGSAAPGFSSIPVRDEIRLRRPVRPSC